MKAECPNSDAASTRDSLPWKTSRKLQEEADLELTRRFSMGGPTHMLLFLAFVLGSGSWRHHPAEIAVFTGRFASTGYCRHILAESIVRRYHESPGDWIAALRRVASFSALLWAALGCWTTIATVNSNAYVFYLVIIAGISAGTVISLSSDARLTQRCLVLLLAPVICTSLALGYFGFLPEGYGLGAVTLLFLGFLIMQARRRSLFYWELATIKASLGQRSEELLEARRNAEASVKMKSEFLACMSHEVRTPMTGVIGMTALLLDTPLSGEQREYLEIVRDSADNLLGLVTDVLDFSNLECGHLQLTESDFDPAILVRRVAEEAAPRAAAKGLEFRVNANSQLEHGLRGDTARIQQILAKLVHNAIKFTPRGRVEIMLDLSTAGRRCELRLEVRDTGVGIAAERIPGLFQRTDRGAGLGLGIVRYLAELMGGRFDMQSTVGEGSRFWVVLPLIVAENETAKPVGQSSTAQGSRVLLVEDSPINERLARRILEKMGCHVDSAHDGLDGVAMATRNSYDLVLMDMEMPNMDGLEATAEIRRWENTQGTPRMVIAAITSNALPGDREKCLAAGVDDYLSKPLRREDLHAALERWVVVPVGRATLPAVPCPVCY